MASECLSSDNMIMKSSVDPLSASLNQSPLRYPFGSLRQFSAASLHSPSRNTAATFVDRLAKPHQRRCAMFRSSLSRLISLPSSPTLLSRALLKSFLHHHPSIPTHPALASPTLLQRHLASASPTSPEPLINRAISRIPHVRLISETSVLLGDMSGADAYKRALTADRDVLLLAPASASSPAVVKIVDYASMADASRRSTYDAKKRKKENLRDTKKASTTKQVRLSPSTGARDFDMKMAQAQRFLVEGYRVRVFMMFRRGQGKLQDEARQALFKAAGLLGKFGVLANFKKSKGNITLDELFPKALLSEDEKADMIAAAAAGKRKKSKPLEVLLTPLKKIDRERIKVESNGSRYDNLDGIGTSG